MRPKAGLFTTEHPDLAVVDLHFSDGNGTAIYRRLRQRKIPFVVYTGYPAMLVEFQIGQSIKGERNPDYYHLGQPYLDGFVAIFSPKQAVRTDAIRADRGGNYGYFSDPEEVDIYDRMLKETDLSKARVPMRQYERRISEQAHQLMVTWWYRIVPMRSYVKGWKISPSHYLNQDLANIWLEQ